MKAFLSVVIVMLSLLGIFDASYITWEKFNGSVPVCSPPFDCGTVLNSPWAQVGPVPLSVLGIFFYSMFLILGSLLLLEKHSLKIANLSVVSLLGIWATFGLLFSLYLVIVMGVVLESWCLYCVISAINCMILFITSLLLIYFYKKDTNYEI